MELGNVDATHYEINALDISAEDLLNIQVECIEWSNQLSGSN
jgi:hypothetical protein